MVEKQYVIFKLENEEYGVEIDHVREITEYKQTTKTPNASSFIDGLINLRGNIVPIINLRKRFNLREVELKNSHRIIIINLEDSQVGFIVDDASQVSRLSQEDIEAPPEIIAGIDRQYIIGIGKRDEKIIILLDFKKLLSDNEKREINKSY